MLAWMLFATTLLFAILSHVWHYRRTRTQQLALEQTHQHTVAAQNTEHRAHVRRLQREFEQSRHQDTHLFVTTLLPALDALAQAVHSAQVGSATLEDLNTGLLYIWNDILNTLQKQGFVPILPQPGDPFDPNKHEGIGVLLSAEHPPGSVAHLLRLGWQHQDKVIRPAAVQIVG